MKNTILKSLALVMVTAFLGIALTSCGGGLSGAYSGDGGFGDIVGSKTTYEFSGSKVTITVTRTLLGVQSSDSYEGNYEIINNPDNSKSIKFTFEDEDATSYNGTFVFEENENTIKIGMFSYTKSE